MFDRIAAMPLSEERRKEADKLALDILNLWGVSKPISKGPRVFEKALAYRSARQTADNLRHMKIYASAMAKAEAEEEAACEDFTKAWGGSGSE